METISSKFLLHFCFFLVLILLCFDGGVSGTNSPCNGSIGECNESLENLMDSEINRRFLYAQRYISPGVLRRDEPVCSGGARGQSYSNDCLPPPSNSYNRGCSKIYRCRSDSWIMMIFVCVCFCCLCNNSSLVN